jgi:hypothetical protein
VGSQSSNLGAVLAALRGWYRCWNAENSKAQYKWVIHSDKLDR